jgi:hypothetical protein
LFVIWATSGYVDIPTGFYFGLSALFAWRWLETGRGREATLAGIAAGLALWTKQAGLMILPSLAGVLALNAWQAAGHQRLLIGLRGQRSALALGRGYSIAAQLKEASRAGLLFLAPVMLIAGPWYLRNYLLGSPAGVVPLPGEFYAAQADHRLLALLPFATRPAEWGWLFAVLAAAGLAWSLVEVLGRREPARPSFLWAFILPYHLAWWWSFSYEARFLLTLLPFYAVLAGRLVDVGLGWLARLVVAPTGRTHGESHWVVTVSMAALCGAVTLAGVWPRLGAVYHLAREPLASEHSIRLRLRPDQTRTVDFLRANLAPERDSILLMDGSLEYFLTGYRTAVFYPVSLAEARAWDYLVLPGYAPRIYRSLGHDQSEFWLALGNPAIFREIYRSPAPDGSTVYEIVD